MQDESLATQAVANGPTTVANPSFEGLGWLVVVNMTVMAAATGIALMALIYLAQMAWKDRTTFPMRTPLRLWRIIGMLFATGIMIRCGVEAASIWGWNPLKPEETAGFLFAKRLLDPIAVACGVSGLALFVLSLPGMVEQLRKEPLPIRLWQSGEVIRNMVALTGLAFVAAVGVVATR